MNGAGTGMVTYQARRQMRARRRALTAVTAVVLGTTALATRWLPTGTATTRSATAATRTSSTTAVASALFASRSNPIWVQKEGAGLASGAAVAGEAARLEHSFCKKLV